LALTDTPWRSDLLPIALATYSDPDNKIQCNYTYSLQQAVHDAVCRNPKIVLIDNEEISVTTENAKPAPILPVFAELTFSEQSQTNNQLNTHSDRKSSFYLESFGGFRERLIETFL